MAVSNKPEASGNAGSRRLFFGSNVLVVILLTVVIVIALNWIGHSHNLRRDMAGGFGGTQLSERAKRVFANAGPDLRITSVYTSDEPENDRKKFLPKVQDLTREIQQFNKSIKVQHLFGGNERAELRDRVQGKFGSAAQKYSDTLKLSLDTWDEVQKSMQPVQKQIAMLLQGDTWLSGFSTMANIAAQFRKDMDNIEQTRKDVDNLVHGEGLPRYQEANTKIKTVNEDLKKHLQDAQTWMQEMNKLAKVLADPKADFAVKSREKLKELTALVAAMRAAAGDPKDTNVPDDPRPAIQEFSKAAIKLSAWLGEENTRVEAFVKAYPAIRRHPKWVIRVPMGPFVSEADLNALLLDTSDKLSQLTAQLREILKATDVPKDQMQSVLRQIRGLAAQIGDQTANWTVGLLALLDEGKKLDPKSPDLKFLATGASGDAFKPVLDKLNQVSTKITELPQLKLDEIANKLQQDNIVVVENDKDVRVVTFDEVWPVADPLAGQFGATKEEDRQRRIFSGDSAISSAALALQVTKPFATVILVGYETEGNPQMRAFGRGGKNTGPVPLEQLTNLKERLEAANFKVKEWNLGAEGEQGKKPEPEEGTQAVYVVLPPAPKPQQNFMMQQPPEKGFGEEQLKKVRDALGKDAKAIFLAVFEGPMGPFAPAPEYEYSKYLADDWGVKVDADYRVIRGVIDKKDPGHYGVNIIQWYYMQLNSFTEQPIGKPLRSRRVLMRNVCPLAQAEKIPEGVTLTPILQVPASTREIWADKDIARMIRSLRSPEGGSFTKDSTAGPDGRPISMDPPFPVMMAAENSKTRSRIVVMGSGLSFTDDYLSQRVMRIEGKGARLVTDPPPVENADLFTNAMLWLSGHQDLIAAGPAEMPVVPVIEPNGQRALWAVTLVWAAAVLVAGLGVMMVRRK